MKIFNLPDLGEGLPDAEIREWLVKEGDFIKLDTPMVAMETAKAVVEVPAPYTGKINKLYGKVGDIMPTGTPLVAFELAESTENPSQTAETRADTGTVAGSLEIGNTILTENPTGVRPLAPTQQLKALPAIRALAKRLNVDLATVTATGPNGQITQADVEQAAAPQTAAANTANLAHYEPLRGTRRAMATAMAQSQREVVPVTLVDDAVLRAWPVGTDITVRVVRALIKGCQAEPALNAWFDTPTLSRHLHEEINLGLAVDAAEGLFVPVIKNVAALDATQLRTTINDYKTAIKDRSIAPEHLRGATIMLSNFGMLAGRYANPIVVPPLVAILGTGRIREEMVAYAGKADVQRVLPLSLTFDHRAVTGGEAARFLRTVIDDLEKTT